MVRPAPVASLAVFVALAPALVACGRAGPGATLTVRRDPDRAAHDRNRPRCVALAQVRRRPSTRAGAPTAVPEYRCVQWQGGPVEHVAAVTPAPFAPGAGPKPPLGLIPTVAVGGAYASQSGGDGGAYWLEARVEGQLVVPGDRLALYVAPGLFAASDQGDLSGMSVIGGVLLAATASLTLDVHTGPVFAEASPWRSGIALRWRPRHQVTHDGTVYIGIEHVAGTDQADDRGDLYPNQTTGIVIGGSYGQVH